MTVEELITALQEMEPTAEVKIAIQPAWAMEVTIYEVISTEDGVYIGADDNNTYLASEAKEALMDEGWGL